jgi:hypothetical protein
MSPKEWDKKEDSLVQHVKIFGRRSLDDWDRLPLVVDLAKDLEISVEDIENMVDNREELEMIVGFACRSGSIHGFESDDRRIEYQDNI